MKTAIETAIKKLTEKSSGSEKAGDAQQYAQAALSLAHAFLMLERAKK